MCACIPVCFQRNFVTFAKACPAQMIFITTSNILCICAGVYLSLSGVVYANNSAIQITVIGKTDPDADLNDGLQCITDRMPCCAATEGRAGEWYFPNGTLVPVLGTGTNMATAFYRNRGDDGTVNLNRLNTNVLIPTGLFCCEVPDVAGDTQPLCANIGT